MFNAERKHTFLHNLQMFFKNINISFRSIIIISIDVSQHEKKGIGVYMFSRQGVWCDIII